MTLKYLLEKEFKQIFRNKFMPALAVVFPLVVMLIMPWAATLDIKNIQVTVIDRDASPLSQELIQKINYSSYFTLTSLTRNYDEGITELEYGDADLIFEIPSGFESQLINFGTAPVQISVNAVNSIKGMLGQSYIMNLINEFTAENIQSDNQLSPKVEILTKNMYNPTLDYKHTMIPGLIMIIMVVLCGFLPAVNIVSEKEKGTIEQLNVTPISKLTFILAKLIPFWIIGLVALTIAFILTWLVYGLVPVGHFITLYLSSGLFILIMTGFGLVISNNSATMQQACFVMFFFAMIFIMMCGLLTPVDSMPGWAQVIASVSPATYMVNILRCVYIKGSSITDLQSDFIILTIMAVIFNVWAVLSYKKSSN